jgi:hypothetical protein
MKDLILKFVSWFIAPLGYSVAPTDFVDDSLKICQAIHFCYVTGRAGINFSDKTIELTAKTRVNYSNDNIVHVDFKA